MAKKRRQPDAELIFKLKAVTLDYDATLVARLFIGLAGHLIATGPNPHRELLAMQRALARWVRQGIKELPEALAALDRIKAGMRSMLQANKSKSD